MTTQSPYTRSAPPPSIRSARSWWSDSNSIGATFNLHGLAKPLMGLMYQREVRRLLTAKKFAELFETDIQLLKSYLLFEHTTTETKTEILIHLRWRVSEDGSSRQAVADAFAAPRSDCLILRILDNTPPGAVYDAACGLLASICCNVNAADLHPDIKMYLPGPKFEAALSEHAVRVVAAMHERSTVPADRFFMGSELHNYLGETLEHLVANVHDPDNAHSLLRIMDDAVAGTNHLATLLVRETILDTSSDVFPRFSDANGSNITLFMLDAVRQVWRVLVTERDVNSVSVSRAQEGMFACIALISGHSPSRRVDAFRGLMSLLVFLRFLSQSSRIIDSQLRLEEPLEHPHARHFLAHPSEQVIDTCRNVLLYAISSGTLFHGQLPQISTDAVTFDMLRMYLSLGVSLILDGQELDSAYLSTLEAAAKTFNSGRRSDHDLICGLYDQLREQLSEHFLAEAKAMDQLEGLSVLQFSRNALVRYKPRAALIAAVFGFREGSGYLRIPSLPADVYYSLSKLTMVHLLQVLQGPLWTALSEVPVGADSDYGARREIAQEILAAIYALKLGKSLGVALDPYLLQLLSSFGRG
ncbi:Cytochrome P450 [Mycena kentingensis (nom. inval.)]|nr:Cytochrome P450 [Mycena kentingensis (nom. inval.)]